MSSKYDFSHLVTDKDGFEIRRFKSYAEAKLFIEDKADLVIKKIDYQLGCEYEPQPYDLRERE